MRLPQQVLLELVEAVLVQDRSEQPASVLVKGDVVEEVLLGKADQAAARIQCMGHQVGGLLPRFPQQDAAAVGKAGPGLRLLELIPEQQFRLGVPPHIPAAQVIEGVIAPARRQQHPGHPGGLVVLAADLVQLIGAVIDQLLPPGVVPAPARDPSCPQLVGQQQAGGVPVEPLGPSPVPLAVSRSQQACPDLFRPAGREVLDLV